MLADRLRCWSKISIRSLAECSDSFKEAQATSGVSEPAASNPTIRPARQTVRRIVFTVFSSASKHSPGATPLSKLSMQGKLQNETTQNSLRFNFYSIRRVGLLHESCTIHQRMVHSFCHILTGYLEDSRRFSVGGELDPFAE